VSGLGAFLTATRADVVALLAPVDVLVAVYDYEPRVETDGPLIATVAVSSITDTDVVVAVRIYRKTLEDSDPGALEEAIGDADDALGASSEFTRSGWDVSFEERLGCMVATTLLIRGREDF
jgi:hypothetical protein